MTTIKYIVSFAVLAVIMSCSRNSIDDAGSVAFMSAFEDVCMEWGSNISAVNQRMEEYELYDMSDGFLKYTDSVGHIISYQFDSDGLCASSLVLADSLVVSLPDFMAGYEYVGILDGSDVYFKEDTFMTTYFIDKDNITYRAVGFTKLR